MAIIKIDLPVTIPKEIENELTYQTVQILREALEKGYCSFEADDSELAYKTLAQLSLIVPVSDGSFVKKNRREYSLINWVDKGQESGKYLVIFDETTDISWN